MRPGHFGESFVVWMGDRIVNVNVNDGVSTMTYSDAKHDHHDAIGQESFEGDTHGGGMGLGAV